MGSAKKAFSGMIWSVAVNVVSALYGFIATPLLIRYFGKADYGLIALATSVNGYMALMDLGLSSTNVRFFANWMAKGEKERVKKLMQTCTAFYGCIGIINALVLAVVLIFSDSIFHVNVEQGIILKKLLGILCVLAVINWYTSCYNQIISATENVAWVQKRTLCTKLLMTAVVILTLVLKFSIVEYYIGVSLAGLAMLPATIMKIRKETPYINFLAKFDKAVFKEILPYSLGVFSFGFFQFTYNHSKVIILGMQGTLASITSYGVIIAISSLVSMVGGVFIQALLPASSRIVATGDQQAFDNVAYRGTHFVTMVLTFCAFGLMTIAKDLVKVYVGDSFLDILPWLYISLLLTITGNVSCISSLILGGSNVKPLAYSSAVASIAAILTYWFSVPYFQVGGIILGMVVYNAIQQIFYYTIYWPKALGINSKRIFFKTDIPFILIGSSIWLALCYVPHFSNSWANIGIFGISFAILYLIACYIFLGEQDIKYIIGLIKKR